jgi:membrane protein required for colicin V production
MTALDIAVVAVLALSTAFAFARGVVRELVAIASWIAGLVAGVRYADDAAALFGSLDVAPAVREVLAFMMILIATLIAGALVAWIARGAVRAIGLGFVDRLLGAAFGLVRGALFVVAFALVAGLTALPRHDWWQNSVSGPVLAASALAVGPHLPADWAARLDFAPRGRAPAAPAPAA